MDYAKDTPDADEKAKASKAKWAEIHKEALEDFKLCVDAEKENRAEALDDLRFARLGEQWPEAIKRKREMEGRPCLTINKMTAFIRQVVNDGRMNKPAIKVHPADDQADPRTAEVINGLIRNIEYSSKADTAYDTGLDFAASSSVGYWSVDMEYSHDDSFDMDLIIKREPNPFAIYGDYASTSCDSADWMRAFKVDSMEKKAFEKKYKGADAIDWDSDSYRNMPDEWKEGKNVIVAAYWRRREVPRTIALLSDGRVVDEKWLEEEVPDMEGLTNGMLLMLFGVQIENTRETTSYKVCQYIMNGVEILEELEWKGRYIPIVPVYGEELNIEGKRYFRSLIRDAKDSQRNFNYWRTTTTELVALAPKAPYIGPVGAFDTDSAKWVTANSETHAHLEYDVVTDPTSGAALPPPQRQPFAGVPAGALQEALNASDDMKAVIGIYDASLGARSNETSGRAINARKVESDTSTFHFIDNQARAIRHTGVILIDLIPHVYNKARIIRVMGEDKKASTVQINQPLDQGEAQIYDLTVGKYDLTVATGPGFQTKREEAAYGMTELVRAFPPAAAVIAPHLAKAQDWPGAEEIAKELEMLAPNAGSKNPEVQAAQQQIQQMGAQIQQMGQALEDKQTGHAEEAKKLEIDEYKAQTDRIKALGLTITPEAAAMLGMRTAQDAAQALGGGELNPGEGMEGGMQEAAGQPEQQSNDVMMQRMMDLTDNMRQLSRVMSAPRRKTIIRGPDGKAAEAHEEIMLEPEESQQEEIPPEEGMQ